jgi:Fe-S cluster biogenesis protein NfuA
MSEPKNLRAIGDRIEQLLDELRAADPRLYDRAEELARMITDLYGSGLERVVELVDDPEVLSRLVKDELVSSLLVVHGLHPEDVATRVERGLETVRPFLAQHQGNVELVDIDLDAGAVLIRLLGSCDGCPSAAITLQQAVERAIVEAAPEIVTIDVAERLGSEVSVPVAMVSKPSYDACPTEIAEVPT